MAGHAALAQQVVEALVRDGLGDWATGGDR